MKKNIIIPLSIIVLGLLAFGGILLGQKLGSSADEAPIVASNNLKQLELSVPGMFCAGCTASVENYTAAVPGVERVQARLTPTKSATVVYDPTVTSPEIITSNEIFQAYGVEILEDKEYEGEVSLQPATAANVPQEIQIKSLEIVTLLQKKEAQGEDTAIQRSLLAQVNRSIENSDFAQANSLLDSILRQLR